MLNQRELGSLITPLVRIRGSQCSGGPFKCDAKVERRGECFKYEMNRCMEMKGSTF